MAEAARSTRGGLGRLLPAYEADQENNRYVVGCYARVVAGLVFVAGGTRRARGRSQNGKAGPPLTCGSGRERSGGDDGDSNGVAMGK